MNEDADLLRRYVKEKSEAAFAELVRRRIGLVYAVAWRHTRDAHTAQDVTQTVFTALARKAPQLIGHQALVGWLHRSAHFAASDAVRAARRQQRCEEEALIMHECNSPTPDPAWSQLSPVVDEVLNGMPAVDRHAVLLRVVDERSYVEIARDLDLGESGARMRVERALEKLRQALARRGITSTAAALTLALGQQAGAAVPAALTSVVASTAVSAAASATGLSAILTLMSTTKVTVTTLGVVALAAIVSSVYQLRVARQAESNLALVANERDQLRARLDRLETKDRPHPAASAAQSNPTPLLLLRPQIRTRPQPPRVVPPGPPPARSMSLWRLRRGKPPSSGRRCCAQRSASGASSMRCGSPRSSARRCGSSSSAMRKPSSNTTTLFALRASAR